MPAKDKLLLEHSNLDLDKFYDEVEKMGRLEADKTKAENVNWVTAVWLRQKKNRVFFPFFDSIFCIGCAFFVSNYFAFVS